MLATQERSLSESIEKPTLHSARGMFRSPGSTPCVCPKIAGPNIRWLESSIHGFPQCFPPYLMAISCAPCLAHRTPRQHHVFLCIGLPVVGGSLCLNTSNGHLSIKNCPEYGCPMLPTAGCFRCFGWWFNMSSKWLISQFLTYGNSEKESCLKAFPTYSKLLPMQVPHFLPQLRTAPPSRWDPISAPYSASLGGCYCLLQYDHRTVPAKSKNSPTCCILMGKTW